MIDLRGLLDGVADYLAAKERAPGELICEKHHIEHGTASYLALLDALRVPWAGEPALRRAARVAERVCARIAVDPAESYTAWIVLPGSRDPHNHANNAIDAGCGVDALTTLGSMHGAALAPALLGRIEESVRKVADTYLVPHAMPKEILAQRLWSLAALGSAYAWLREPSWRDAGMAAIERTYAQQHADGSFPYTPLGTPRSHEGSSDVSAFYHSRHALFLIHALRCFGADPRSEPHAPRLRAASDFLLALRRADGFKCAWIEAKPWYWNSEYEAASHAFDAPALAAAYDLYQDPRYGEAAADLMQLWAAHVLPDGGVDSHRGAGWNFQCRTFWNAHAAWIAREAPSIERLLRAGVRADRAPRLAWFPDAGVAHYEDERAVVLLRGRKPRANLLHGSAVGGGALLHAASRREPSRDLVGKRAGDALLAGEWSVVPARGPGRAARVRKALRENRDALRFASWIARVRARAGGRIEALRGLAAAWRDGVLVASRGAYSSGTASAAHAQHVGMTLAFQGTVADRFGDALPGVRTIRRYVFEPGCVRAGDAVTTERPLRSCIFRLPAGADQASFDGGPARVRDGVVDFGRVAAGATVAVRYRLFVSSGPPA